MIKNIVMKMVDDTHYYFVDGEFYPSVTRILDIAAPKEYGLLKFFKDNTNDEIKDISNKALANGSAVHDACEKLLNGEELPLADYSFKAQKAIWTFAEWFKLFKPTNVTAEQTVASKKYRYGGTLDMVCNIDNELLNAHDKGKREKGTSRVIVDFKTNKNGIYYSNKLQVMAYDQAYEETTEESIDEDWVLRLGSKHKCGYEFKRVDQEVGVKDFMNVYDTYLRINGGDIEKAPTIDVYPDVLSLGIEKAKELKEDRGDDSGRNE